MQINVRLEAFITRDDRFYVYCDENLVACVAKVDNGWQPMEPQPGKVKATYKSAIMAAFADANLSKDMFWQGVS